MVVSNVPVYEVKKDCPNTKKTQMVSRNLLLPPSVSQANACVVRVSTLFLRKDQVPLSHQVRLIPL